MDNLVYVLHSSPVKSTSLEERLFAKPENNTAVLSTLPISAVNRPSTTLKKMITVQSQTVIVLLAAVFIQCDVGWCSEHSAPSHSHEAREAAANDLFMQNY